jgi:hypothetical protein
MNGFSERRIKCLHLHDSLQIPETRLSFHFGEKVLRNVNSIAVPSASLTFDVGEMMIEDHGFAPFDFEARFQNR